MHHNVHLIVWLFYIPYNFKVLQGEFESKPNCINTSTTINVRRIFIFQLFLTYLPLMSIHFWHSPYHHQWFLSLPLVTSLLPRLTPTEIRKSPLSPGLMNRTGGGAHGCYGRSANPGWWQRCGPSIVPVGKTTPGTPCRPLDPQL